MSPSVRRAWRRLSCGPRSMTCVTTPIGAWSPPAPTCGAGSASTRTTLTCRSGSAATVAGLAPLRPLPLTGAPEVERDLAALPAAVAAIARQRSRRGQYRLPVQLLLGFVAGGREHLVERAADCAAHRAGTPLSLVREVDPAELHGDH